MKLGITLSLRKFHKAMGITNLQQVAYSTDKITEMLQYKVPVVLFKDENLFFFVFRKI